MPQKPQRKPLTGGTAKRAVSNSVTLRPVRPGAGIEKAYQKRLDQMLLACHRSVMWWIAAEYKKHPPAIAQDTNCGCHPQLAQDASPIEWLTRLVGRLRNRWMRRIEETAPRLAEYFATAVQKRSDAVLKKILKDGGWTINFTMTPAMRDVREAAIAENVSLIRSIPSQYFSDIEGIISRGYANGYDLKTVTDQLKERFRISRKRAAFIASDQSSKLNSQLSRARYIENKLTTARWTHSKAGKMPRPSHLHVMNGQEYDLREGLHDPDPKVNRKIHAGELIRCRCIARIVVPFGRADTKNSVYPNRSA